MASWLTSATQAANRRQQGPMQMVGFVHKFGRKQSRLFYYRLIGQCAASVIRWSGPKFQFCVLGLCEFKEVAESASVFSSGKQCVN